eukprot:TRINITY_DN850_c0_g1_i1.p1 TRINITY_DN850_c0_g1~~TRINITY_DN850_c0_g1_i1.p1  ORF type:complete len:93 (+),score=20.12 TRINITY_DN850_c0_g1_i1:53-331(+)
MLRAALRSRLFSTEVSKQNLMKSLLTEKLQATKVNVIDMSGGCGSMFQIDVESPMFEGQTMVKQHRMVNEVLKAEIKEMHGLTLRTAVPKKN